MTGAKAEPRSKRKAALLAGWVVGCLLIAGIAAAALSGGGDDRGDDSAAAPTTLSDIEPAARPHSPADTTVEDDEGEEADEEPDPAAEEPTPTTEPASSAGESPTTEAPPEPVLVADGDADGDGVLDDWVAPDADSEAYRPGDQAVDGEFEEDRRAANGCEPAYPDVCVPPAPPVLTCEQAGVSNVLIDAGGDPHGFDSDYDGIGCEAKGEGVDDPLSPDQDPPSS